MQNRKLRYNGQRYEVFWTSQLAEHVATNHFQQPGTHPLLHERIGYLICEKTYLVLPQPSSRKLLFLVLDPLTNRVFQAYVTLLPGPHQGRDGRAIVHTCFITSNLTFQTAVHEKATHPKARR